MDSKSKGSVLRSMGGGQIRVVTTRQDWETRMIPVNKDQMAPAVGMSLVSFQAESYREFKGAGGEGTDIWDFVVIDGPTKFHVFLHGEDIFMLYVPSAVL